MKPSKYLTTDINVTDSFYGHLNNWALDNTWGTSCLNVCRGVAFPCSDRSVETNIIAETELRSLDNIPPS